MSIAALPITRSDRCGSVLAGMNAHLDQLLKTLADEDLPSGDLPATLREIERVRRRLDAARLRLIAVADRERLPQRGGHAATSSWVGRQTHSDGRVAAGDTMLADALGNGTIPTPSSGLPTDVHQEKSDEAEPTRSATGAALDEGRISTDHAKIIVRTLAELPDWVTAEQRAVCEEAWSVPRSTARPPSLTLAGAILRKIIDTMVAPRRDQAAHSTPAAGTTGAAEERVHADPRASDETGWRAGQLDWQHRPPPIPW